jgi:hypothetical protein
MVNMQTFLRDVQTLGVDNLGSPTFLLSRYAPVLGANHPTHPTDEPNRTYIGSPAHLVRCVRDF